jgi:hypothetical protein
MDNAQQDSEHEVCEYHVLPEVTRDLARRDSRAAQRMFALMLSNWIGRDGFAVQYGDYDGALSVEIQGSDGRRLVLAPLFKWEQGDAFEDDWEWAMRGADGQLIDHPDDPEPFGCSSIWGSRGLAPDLAEGIRFYRDALDEAHELAKFEPLALSAAEAG